MTWISPAVFAAIFGFGIWVGRTQPSDRMRERIAEDPEVGRSLVRSGRGWVGRVMFVFLVGGCAVSGVRFLLDGQLVGIAWWVVVALALISRRESRRMTARVVRLLDEPQPVTEQDRIRDRFSAAYAVVALVSLTASQLLTDGFEQAAEPWRLVVGSVLLGVTFIAGVAAMWSQAWVFSERRWSRRG